MWSLPPTCPLPAFCLNAGQKISLGQKEVRNAEAKQNSEGVIIKWVISSLSVCKEYSGQILRLSVYSVQCRS